MKQLEFNFSNKRRSKKRKVFSIKTNATESPAHFSKYNKILTNDEIVELKSYLANLKLMKVPSPKAEMAYHKITVMDENNDLR